MRVNRIIFPLPSVPSRQGRGYFLLILFWKFVFWTLVLVWILVLGIWNLCASLALANF
jgi:hypothetical protein